MRVRSLSLVALIILAVGLACAGASYADGGRRGGHDDNEAEFKGTVESLPASGFVGDWVVSGRTVHVSASTRIEQKDGPVRVGAFVEVEGTSRSDGSVDATKIETEDNRGRGGDDRGGDDDDDNSGSNRGDVELKGTIQSLPPTAGFIGDWQVGSRTVRVTSSTSIEQEIGPVVVGAFVEVKGTPQANGIFLATRIEVKSNAAGDDARHEIKGPIQSLPASGLIGDWRVAGRTVHVTSSTIIDQEHGAAVVGAFVEVHGTLADDGSFNAARIEVKPAATGNDNSNSGGSKNFKGTIESMPASGFVGDWVISGRTVRVTSSTQIKQEHGQVGVGVRVKVKTRVASDGVREATRIQVRD